MIRVKAAPLLLALSLIFAGCTRNSGSGAGEETRFRPIRAAVVFDSAVDDGNWRDCYSHLDQGLVMNLEAKSMDISGGVPSLSGCDVIFPDASVMMSKNALEFKNAAERFAMNGGSVFVENSFYGFFDTDFLGAKGFTELDALPEINVTSKDTEFSDIKSIVADFVKLYGEYEDFDRLSGFGFGAAMTPDTAVPILSCANGALYAINSYGNGRVFFASALLPNLFSINGFDNISKSDAQKSLANTTASANQLIRSYFCAYVARERDGFSAERVFGVGGSPSIAWELHAEEITGFQNGSEVRFATLAEKYGQVPSYTLVRSTYWWFLRAESVTYLLGKSDGFGGVYYDMDFYENAYDSGTHIAVDYDGGSKWLSLAEITNTSSFFYDDPDYADVKPLPAVLDYDGDGLLDLVCGSSDGNIYFFRGKGYTDRWHVEPPVILDKTMAERIEFPGKTDLNGYVGDVSLNEPSHTGELTAKFGMNASAVYADINGDGIDDLIVGELEYGRAYPIDSPYFPYREQLQKQIDSLLKRGYYIGAHFYTNRAASVKRETYELAATISALEGYGIDLSLAGINQHTWHISGMSPNQSLLAALDAGFLWSSGFEPQSTELDPNDSAETVISLPYFLTVNTERTMLIQNVSPLLFNSGRAEISAKYNMPMCVYNHCDFTYRDELSELTKIETVADFVSRHDYSFVSEPQMMKATAAEYNAFISASVKDGVITLSASGLSEDFPLYDVRYQNAVGAKVTFMSGGPKYDTNADIYRRDGDSIYIALNKPVSFTPRSGIDRLLKPLLGDKTHLLGINVPAKITSTEKGAVIEFLDGVMNEVRVSGKASAVGEGWTKRIISGVTVFTRYGDAATLEIEYR